MNLRLITEGFDNLYDIEEEIDYIKDRDLSSLKVELILDQYESNDLIEHIIYDDTQISLSEYDLFLENGIGLKDLLGDRDEESDEEIEYIKKTLCKKYSPGIMNDIVKYVLQYTCEIEVFSKMLDEYDEECLKFCIKVEDFNEKDSTIVKYIKRIIN